MELGLGAMGLALRDFWSMTMPEFRAALDGWMEARGGRNRPSAAITRAELDDMMRRFPD
jgi:uncharacterized phage protein (TIGR02216 family)